MNDNFALYYGGNVKSDNKNTTVYFINYLHV